MHRAAGTRRITGATIMAAGILLGIPFGEARDVYVSPSGSDDGPGTREQPFATLAQAVKVVGPGDTCHLRAGIYREVLRPERSGTAAAEITFAAYREEEAIISAADRLGDWRKEDDGVWSASMAWTLGDGNQLFGDGAMLSEACWPAAGGRFLFHPERASAAGGTPNTLVCAEVPGPDDAWKGAKLRCAGGSAWICWTATVTGYDAASHALSFDKAQDTWYTPREGSLFSLRGIRRALHAPGQWFHDAGAKRMLLIPPKGTLPGALDIEAKRRLFAIDLADRSHIRLRGITFRAGGIRSNGRSSHLVLENLKGRYVGHSLTGGTGGKSGVLIQGSDNLVLSCDIGYGSNAVLAVKGRDHRIINCHLHHGSYAGMWSGAVTLSGRRILFSHNTVRHAGRDLIGTHGLMESLVQNNDVSEAGWLTKDLGMFYGHNTDFANTQFRHNLVHDNHAAHCSMGIYFDHLSHNAIVHHNVVWNVGMDPIRINNPSYCNLVFNNTCWSSGKVGTFDHSKREDLFASRFCDNIYSVPSRLPEHVAQENNQVLKSPSFTNAQGMDFRLTGNAALTAGAMPAGASPWHAGCDLENPPFPLPSYEAPQIPWMNGIRNACFEFGSLEGWQSDAGSKATLVEGNGWGNGFGRGKAHATGTSKFELRLGPGRSGVGQVVGNLLPDKRYELSAWLRVSGGQENIVLGVRNHGGEAVEVSSSSPDWTRKTLPFTTGPKATSATIFVRKTSGGAGHVWADNFTLPLRPR